MVDLAKELECSDCGGIFKGDPESCPHCGELFTQPTYPGSIAFDPIIYSKPFFSRDYLSFLYLRFDGRLSRYQFIEAKFLLILLTLVIPLFLAKGNDGAVLFYFVVSTFPSIALSAKRLHDMDMSGWYLLLSLVPFANVWVGFRILFRRGTIGPNSFGSPSIA